LENEKLEPKTQRGRKTGGTFTKLKQSFKHRFDTCVKKSRMKSFQQSKKGLKTVGEYQLSKHRFIAYV
jgi:hypothetical protein